MPNSLIIKHKAFSGRFGGVFFAFPGLFFPFPFSFSFSSWFWSWFWYWSFDAMLDSATHPPGCVALSNRQKSGHSTPAVEKGAVICLFFGCFYALTFCISVNNSVFALFCACLCRFCVCRRVSRSFCGLFSGSVVTFFENFFLFQVVANQVLRRLAVFWGENFFW